MALGQQLITSILANELKRSNEKHVKGIFTDQRDKAMVCRLYYYYKVKGLRYDIVVGILSKEFYLGETTIAQIIMKERDLLENLKKKRPTGALLANYSLTTTGINTFLNHI